MSLAPNNAGRVGSTFAWGGGTGTTRYHPGAAVNNSPASAIDTSPNYYLWGSGNTCTDGGLPRWGDYLTVRTYKANPAQWVAAGYRDHRRELRCRGRLLGTAQRALLLTS